jgi:hypothetical protein
MLVTCKSSSIKFRVSSYSFKNGSVSFSDSSVRYKHSSSPSRTVPSASRRAPLFRSSYVRFGISFRKSLAKMDSCTVTAAQSG